LLGSMLALQWVTYVVGEAEHRQCAAVTSGAELALQWVTYVVGEAEHRQCVTVTSGAGDSRCTCFLPST
jgi:hypothetical protein